jgi:hypothetical protein
MRRFLLRLFFYVLAFLFLNSVFGSWPEPLAGSTLDGKIGFYLGYYGVLVGLFVVICEGAYHTFKRRKPSKEKA